MIRIPEDRTVRRSITTMLVVIGVASTIIRMVAVGLWCVQQGRSIDEVFLVEASLTILSDIAIVCMIGIVVIRIGRPRETLTYEPVASALTTYSVSALALLVFAAIVPDDFDGGRITSLLGVVTSHLVAIGTFAISIGLAGFLATLLLMRRHERTRLYLIVQVIILLGIWLCSTLGSVSPVFTIINVVLTVFGAILMLINTQRLNWLATITMEKKIRLLWLTVCALFASIVLSVMHVSSVDAYVTESAASFVRSGAILPSAINFFGFVFFLRFLFAVIAALPNSAIVDRRSSEVESLAHITRLMTAAVSVEHLLNSTTDLALRICRAHGAWMEVDDGDGMQVAAAQLVHPEYVRALHANPTIHELISNGNGPVHVQSLSDLTNDAGDVAVRSMIIIPIYSDHRRMGTLVVFSTVDYGFELDDVRLLTAFGDMVSVALDQARLMEAALTKERLQKEADVARDIQSSLLPRSSPDIRPFNVHAVMIPATEVGGDYFDYIRFADGTQGVIIADVAGKGIPAALYMATLKGAVLAEMRVSAGPADLLRRVNETLFGSMEKHSYISLTCVQFSIISCSLRIARAGHTPAICRVGSELKIIQPRGVAIGIVPPRTFNSAIEEVEVSVGLGDICLLTTDGVTERRDPDMEEIGMDTVADMVRRTVSLQATDLVQETLDVVERHARGADPHDDITIVGIVVSEACATDADSDRMEPTGIAT
ncbi:MAG TPA: SpoIIE family protein phosphatase [Candidatus Didemnitutus sp.]|nr:SpoIIE family protein phosphatase [Candidatus Didemnitutus sp.]